MKHTFIFELKVQGIGSYGLFADIDSVRQELKNNSVVWNKEIPYGLELVFFNDKNLIATAYPKALFYTGESK